MRHTMKDVARAAGVAPSTVSRVLAGSSRISPDTHERVRKAMRDLNYHPNAIARSLARSVSHTIGLVIARPADQAFANPFFAEVVRGISSVLNRAGYNLLLLPTDSPEHERQGCLRLLRGRRADGVILATARVNDPLVADLAREDHRFVVIGRVPGSRPVTWVNNDNVAVGHAATQHLLDRGHRRIALINGPSDLVVSLDRREGYAQALSAAGLSPDAALMQDGGFTREGGYHAMLRLLDQTDPPTGVFCTDDTMAVGALQACGERQAAVPGRVALVGVNDDPLAAHVYPPLTTVRIPVFELGATAARTLVDMLSGELTAVRQIILPSELISRASTDS